MAEVTLQLGNEHDVPAEDLDRLEVEMQAVDPSLTFTRTSVPHVGRGVTWWEVLYIWLPTQIGSAVTKQLITAIIKWARSRYKGTRDRPKYIAIYGPDGREVRSVLVTSKRGKLEEKTETTRSRPRPEPSTRHSPKE
jgi:hypothetical protein